MPSTSGITDSSEHWNSGETPFNFAMAHDYAMPRGNGVMKKACKVNQDIYAISNKCEDDSDMDKPTSCCRVFCGKLVKRIATHLLTHKDQKVISRLYTLKGMPDSKDVTTDLVGQSRSSVVTSRSGFCQANNDHSQGADRIQRNRRFYGGSGDFKSAIEIKTFAREDPLRTSSHF